MVQNDPVVLGHKEIGPTVSIIISHCRPHPISAARDVSFFGYVGEGSVAVVLVKGIAHRWLRIEEIALPAVDEINVHPPIVVVIDECAPGTYGFGQVHLWRSAVAVHPRDAACCGWNNLKGKFDTALGGGEKGPGGG